MIETHQSVGAYFYEQVESALRDLGVPASPRAAHYLVNLLVENTRASTETFDEPLGLQYVRCQGVPLPEKVRGLRELGDTALYLSGFFRDSLRDAAVTPDYYAQLGATAYDQAGGLLRAFYRRADLGEVLVELADGFGAFADALAQVGELAVGASGGPLQLYERWLRTRSPLLERVLREHGMLLSRPERPT